MAKLDQIIEDCNKLQCKMIVVVPSMDLTGSGYPSTRSRLTLSLY